MNNKIIHQIFIDIGQGTTYLDNPIYKETVEKNKEIHVDFEFKIWDEPLLDKLVKEKCPEYIEIWNDFPDKMHKIDFGKYLILLVEGGIYLDLDDIILEPINLENDYIFGHYTDDKGRTTHCSNIIYYKHKEELKFMIDLMVKKYRTNKMPNSWKVRRLLHTISVKAFHQILSKNFKIKPKEYTIKFYSYETRSWLKFYNKKVKHY
jgi:mannosyltransferase OCH1-like enzyme